MRNLKYSLPILLAAALLAGCGGSSAKLQSDDVAVVGSQHITKAQFDQLMAQAKKSFVSQGRKFPKQGTAEYETVKGQAVSLLVQQAEREEKAKSMGVKVSDADIQKRLDQIKKQYFGGSEKTYLAQLKKRGLTDEQVRQDVRQQLLGEAIQAKLTKGLKVSKSEEHQYYLSHSTLYSQPTTRDVRYILIGKSKAVADQVYAQLKNGNDATWCKLAKKYAKDASGQNCGKATFTKGQTVPVFDTAAFTTPTNVVHKPFYDATQYKAWFVVEPLSAVKKSTVTPEKQVTAQIDQQVLSDKKSQAISDWVKSLKKTFCGGKIKYQVGYTATPDPCASTTTNATTT